MNKQRVSSMMRRLWRGVASCFFSRETRRISDNPQWAGFTIEERKRCEMRIRRLNHEYRSRYRFGGNLKLPEIYDVTDVAVRTRCLSGKTEMTLGQASGCLNREQIDILMRTVLMQLGQLESIGYVHCALNPEHLILKYRKNVCRAEITGLESGHFIDETEAIPTPVETDYLSPEEYRRLRYPGACVGENGDIFSAGCIYYYLLTGRELKKPADALLRLRPLCVSTVFGPCGSLIRWMLEPNAQNRPRAAEVLDAMDDMQSLGLMNREWQMNNQASLVIKDFRVCGQWISEIHAKNQCIATSDDGQLLLVRCMTACWNPGGRKKEGEGRLMTLHRRIYDWNMKRLQLVSSRSIAWNHRYPLITPARVFESKMWPVIAAPLTAKAYITLNELNRYDDSLFLLDARMTEILFSVQVLHDDRFWMGAMSPALFGVKMGYEGAQVELLDLSGVISLEDTPEPDAIEPGPEAIEYLSPELAQYIAVSPLADSDELMDMRERLGPASDIFALGLIYHTILTGHLPKPSRPEYSSCADAVCFEARPEDAVVLDESIDGKHAELIFQMLSMNPLNRPMRCDEIISRILDFYTA